jgi:hypothetical protein
MKGCGSTLREFVTSSAKKWLVEYELSKLVSEPQFLPYRKVFARFGLVAELKRCYFLKFIKNMGFKNLVL